MDKRTLRELRRLLGLTQKELADRAGCVQSEISKIEKGRIPKFDLAQRIARALEVEAEYIKWN
ncbi:helix-turn-helix domain-containing protein [Heliomicrobium gestii]|uniref:helix-turn-helix domain-containing protein n=1 Tax=Heliomicrobium gestii TaxID=2699 RepID=UPI0038B2BB2C